MTNRAGRKPGGWLRLGKCAAAAGLAAAVSGCAALAVGGAVVGTAVSVVGTVVVTGVELTGKAVGAGIDAMSDDDAADDSGITIKYTERPASAPLPVHAPPAAASEPARPLPVR